jgi:hypothetical protein
MPEFESNRVDDDEDPVNRGNDSKNVLKTLLFVVFGISMLLPWNTWITITGISVLTKEWFDFRLKESPFSDVFKTC